MPGLGDPCLPFKGEYDNAGGDQQADAMTELFRVCYAEFGDKKVLKKEIYKCVHVAMKDGNDVLSYFGALEDDEESRANQTKLGTKLTRFKNRELAGIKLLIEENSANSSRNQYRFIKIEPETPPEGCKPVNLCKRLASYVRIDFSKHGAKSDDKKDACVGGTNIRSSA